MGMASGVVFALHEANDIMSLDYVIILAALPSSRLTGSHPDWEDHGLFFLLIP
jgi:hypothetical protein